MPLPLAPLTATGDARDPTTMRTACVVAAAMVTAMWWRGAWSSWRSSWCALFLKSPELGLFLTLSQVTNFRDHDAPDRLRDTKACQKESFYVIICII